jgi:tRNA/rRNA methyltransferase
VDTKTPANIGAVARCMMNMSLHRLVLVNPPADRLSEAVKLAAGAEKILDSAVIHTSLKKALADQGLAVGVSRHSGRMRKNVNSPRDLSEKIAPYLVRNGVSFVFGNEVNGLDKSDLALCDEFVSIPSSDAFPSLNLSHAVMVLAYELFVAAHGRQLLPSDTDLARKEDLENFYDHLRRTSEDIGFLDRKEPDRIMFTLRQIFGRARLDDRDVSILRGILSAVNRCVRKQQGTASSSD